MKHQKYLLMIMVIMLVSCGSGFSTTDEVEELTLTDGVTNQTYSILDLEALPETQVVLDDITYIGVLMSTLLEDAQYDLEKLKAVKAVASDGFSANYDPLILKGEDVILAYATADGPLKSDEGQFRMVLPGESGKLNVRMLGTLQVIP